MSRSYYLMLSIRAMRSRLLTYARSGSRMLFYSLFGASVHEQAWTWMVPQKPERTGHVAGELKPVRKPSTYPPKVWLN